MSDRLAIIGSRDSILGFKALGLDCYPTDNPSDALEVVNDLIFKKQGYAAIYLTDDLASKINTELENVKKGAPLLPILIIIPSHKGSLNMETIKIRKMVEKALGTDIFKEEKK